MKGELFILSAPAGGGKTTIAQLLLKEIPNLYKITTCTTRKPRKGEVDGKDYYFLSTEEFEEKIKQGEFLEYAKVHGNYYGTPKSEVERLINEGKDVLLIIDVQGMMQIKGKIRPMTTIFLIPPSFDELINRMRKRGDSEEEIKKRIETAKREIPLWKEYDYIVINDVLLEAKDNIKRIILAHRNKTERFDLNLIKDEELRKLMNA